MQGLRVRAARSEMAWSVERRTTTRYNRGMDTRSHNLQTRRSAEEDSEEDAKGDVSETLANMSSGTSRAGERISEMVSSGR